MEEKQHSLANNHDFLNPQLTIENMDVFFIRKSILNSLKNKLPEFHGTVLDIGCGEMPYKQLILSNSNVEKYIGLDIENSIYQQNSKPDLFWNGNKIPLGDNSIEYIVATELFEHIPNPVNIMREVLRVLKTGGILFFTVPFIWNLHDVPNDEYRYTPFALNRLLREAGFKEIHIGVLGGWDASLAQMIGLWARRSQMRKTKRKLLSCFLKPIVSYLIKKDKFVQIKFEEQQMFCGLYGTARK